MSNLCVVNFGEAFNFASITISLNSRKLIPCKIEYNYIMLVKINMSFTTGNRILMEICARHKRLSNHHIYEGDEHYLPEGGGARNIWGGHKIWWSLDSGVTKFHHLHIFI